MGAPIRILHFDDNPLDAQLVALTLENEHERLPSVVTFVQTKEEFLSALERKDFDIILSDYRMPGFDGEQALAAAKERCPEIPFIMVTGELGEELVIQTLHRGATDYVLKDRMFRLIPAIERALGEAENERKRSESEEARELLVEELGKRQGELLAIIQAMHGGVMVFDTEGNVVMVNDAEAEMLGYRYRSEVERPLSYFAENYEFHLADGTVVPVQDWPVMHVMHGETVINQELKGRRKETGQEWFFSFSGQPVRDQSGKQILSVLVTRDITERKQAEEGLRRAERTTGEILESIQDPFYTLDGDWRVTYVNSKAEEFMKKTRDELLGKNLWDVFPMVMGTESERILKTAMESRQPLRGEYKSILNNVWVSVHIFPKADGGLSVLYRDISDRKAGEEALRLSEERFAATFKGSPYPLSLSRVRDGMVLEVNDTLLKLYGATRDEVVGKTTFELGIWPDLRERERILEIIKREGKIFEGETILKTRAREERRVLVTVTLVSAEQEPTVLSVINDITERKRTEEALLEAALFAEENPSPVLRISHDGMLLSANRASGPILEHLKFGLKEKVPSSLDGPVTKALSESGPHTFDFSLKGAIFSFLVVPVQERQYANLYGRDVTVQRHAEAEVRKLNEELEQRVRERTAALERANKELEAFSYSVSHDLKAPLRLISGFAGLMTKQGEENFTAKQRESLATIQEQATRMDELIRALLEFSRVSRKEPKLASVDTRQMAKEVIAEQRKLLGGEAGEKVIVEFADLPVVKADPILLRIVFTNLLSNAFKFTRTVAQPRITIEAKRANDFYSFRIADNGVGFPRGHTEKLFQVFQRLHASNEFEGSGIGLANVRKIVQRHGGEVCGDGDEGKGAYFLFTLPDKT